MALKIYQAIVEPPGIDSVQDYAIYTRDVEGRVTTWNSEAARLKGYTESEIIGWRRLTDHKNLSGGCDFNSLNNSSRGIVAKLVHWSLIA